MIESFWHEFQSIVAVTELMRENEKKHDVIWIRTPVNNILCTRLAHLFKNMQSL